MMKFSQTGQVGGGVGRGKRKGWEAHVRTAEEVWAGTRGLSRRSHAAHSINPWNTWKHARRSLSPVLTVGGTYSRYRLILVNFELPTHSNKLPEPTRIWHLVGSRSRVTSLSYSSFARLRVRNPTHQLPLEQEEHKASLHLHIVRPNSWAQHARHQSNS